MKKALMILFGGALLLGPAAASADVRDMGMGIRAEQGNGVDNVFDWPHLISNFNMYDHRMGFDPSNFDDWGGIIREDDYIGRWGLYYDRPVGNQFGTTGFHFVDAMFNGVFDGSMSWSSLLTGTPPNDVLTSTTDGGAITADFDPVGFNLGTINTPERNFDFLKAFPGPGAGTLGVRVEYGQDKQTDLTSSNTEADTPAADDVINGADTDTASLLGVALSYGQDAAGPFDHVDVGLGYTTGSFEIKNQSTEQDGTGNYDNILESDGISSIRLKARGVKNSSENTAWFFNAAVRLDKLAGKETWRSDVTNDGDTTDASEMQNRTSEYKDTNIMLGVNANQTVNDGKGLVVAGLGIVHDKMTRKQSGVANADSSSTVDQLLANSQDEWEQSYLGLWGNIGVEGKLTSWLTLRSGVSKSLYSTQTTKVTEKDDLAPGGTSFEDTRVVENKIDPNENLTVTAGVGVEVGNWSADLLLASGDLHDFLTFPSPGDGVFFSDNGAIIQFAALDLRYHFNSLFGL